MKSIFKSQLKKPSHFRHKRKSYIGKVPLLTVVVARSHRLKENPEVSMRLTNLSQRHAGKRPTWFDFEPLKLSSHTRQCKRIFWQIVNDHRERRKRIIALTADAGMGKTAFLAELYALLDHARETILTLAPVVVNRSPFEMIRNILEQRLYISGTASLESIRRFVESAVISMIPGEEGRRVSDCMLNLWRKKVVPPPIPRPKMPPPIHTQITRVPGQPVDDKPNLQVFDKDTAEEIELLSKSLTTLFRADLERNSLVIMLDDVMHYDRASLNLLGLIYNALPNLPLTILMTLPVREMMPPCFRNARVDYIDLQSLSDEELVQLTQHLVAELSKNREKVIIPDEICRRIAQLSLGSPKYAIQLTLKNIDKFPQASELLERLKRAPVRKTACDHLVSRFKACLESERIILRFASLLNAPFTVFTIESLLASWQFGDPSAAIDCREALRQLREKGFIDKAPEPYGSNTTTYVFNLEYERYIIAQSASEAIREHVYRTAPQWYALNNINHRYDEVIGDLWSKSGLQSEACHYYVRAAYRAYHASQLTKAKPLFRKLLANLPEEDIARRIQYLLDNADIAFRLGSIDEAFMLCRRASHYAHQISSYAQSAKAYIQMACMLAEIGSLRHIRRYLSHAQQLLNCESDPQMLYMLHITMARIAILRLNASSAQKHLDLARRFMSGFAHSDHDLRDLSFIEARLEGVFNNPGHALEQLTRIGDQASASGDIRTECQCLCAIGQIHLKIGNITEALESWNKALGLAQEMNDAIMHASLLADIADGAIALEAHRTARSASEQCLHIAQQTHQKALIARCLGHTACLQTNANQPDRALRSLCKSQRIAHSLRNTQLYMQILRLFSVFFGKPDHTGFKPLIAERIYAHLIRSTQNCPLCKCEILTQYANYLIHTHQLAPALQNYRNLQTLLHRLGFEKACDKVKQQVDRLELL